MYLTVHAAAGAAIGQFTGNPFLGFVAGVVSHFILDVIPHGDEGISKWHFFKTPLKRTVAASVIDFFVMIIFLIVWLRVNNDLGQLSGLLTGMAGGAAPDALWGFQELTGDPILKPYRKFHNKAHDIFKTKLSMKQGFLLQIPILIALTLIIIWF